MSHPIDQIDNPRTKPLQVEHDGQKNSGRSQSDVRLENCESRAKAGFTEQPDRKPSWSGHAAASVVPCQKKCSGRCDDRRHRVPLQRSAGADAHHYILHGEGKHFSASVDLSSVTDARALASVRFSRSWHRAFDRIENGDVPVIAVLHGAVIGGGLELAAGGGVRPR